MATYGSHGGSLSGFVAVGWQPTGLMGVMVVCGMCMWYLVCGEWLVVGGWWLVVGGCWLLVVGCWLLAVVVVVAVAVVVAVVVS